MLTWEYLVDTVRDDLPFILSVGTGCAISASCLEKRKHFYLRVALTLLLAFCWMYGTRPYVGMNMQGTRMGIIRYITAFVLFMLSVPFCSRANFCQALYAVTVAYSLQNMCERIIHIPRYSLPNFPVLLDRSCLLALMAIALYIYYRILVGKRRQRTIMDFSNMCVVTFDLNYDGAPAASTQEVSKGGTASEPAAPARDGYEFVAWYADADYTHTYDFAAPVTGDTTVYAFWKKVGADFVTVTFDYDYYGVLLNQYSYPVEVGAQVKQPVANPERTGYAFDKWVDENGSDFDFSQPIAADTTIKAAWNKTVSGQNTYVFEAEDTDLTGKIGPSYSGSAQEESMIIYNESVGASGNRMVGYLYASGISLEFYIASDMDVDDATIDVSITGEFVTMSYDGNDYQVIVNGEAKSYPRVTIEATQSSMPQCADLISIKGVHLNKGANLIQLMTNNTNEVDGTTFKAYAPIVDCVKVTTEAVLIWDENHNEPAMGNYQK